MVDVYTERHKTVAQEPHKPPPKPEPQKQGEPEEPHKEEEPEDDPTRHKISVCV